VRNLQSVGPLDSGGPVSHLAITPSILYFGTPVALLTTENPDGTFNLAPMSSAWALGQVIVLGLGEDGQTARNLRHRPDLVINLPAAALWPSVERLAGLTGRPAIPPGNIFTYEPAKFAAAGLSPEPADVVRPPRVAECPLQMEARVVGLQTAASGSFLIIEAEVLKVHADPYIVVPGTQHIHPARWSPLVYNFRHYFGLGPELGRTFRSELPPRGQ
jgi:flavin reductase (DIM6/NTAB) family NADH-FMN oxidoreductase RutF